MSSLSAEPLVAAIIDVLQRANTGKGSEPGFLTAYQILHRLPDDLRRQLEQEYVPGGKGAGEYYSASTHVARATVRIDGVERVALDTGGLQFALLNEDDVEAGYGLCALFRLSPDSDLWSNRPHRAG